MILMIRLLFACLLISSVPAIMLYDEAEEDPGPPYLLEDEECRSFAGGNCTGVACAASTGSCAYVTTPNPAYPTTQPPLVDVGITEDIFIDVPVPIAIPTVALLSFPWPHDQCVTRPTYGCWINNDLPVVPCRFDWQFADSWCVAPVCRTVQTIPPCYGTKIPEY